MDEVVKEAMKDDERLLVLSRGDPRVGDRSTTGVAQRKVTASSTPTTAVPNERVSAPTFTQDETTEEILTNPKILVIGDRLFTDIVLADRLSRLLPYNPPSSSASLASAIPSVLSIYTTSLPQPNDVRPLRWLESTLSRGQVKSGSTDWSRFVNENTTVNDAMALRSMTLSARMDRLERRIADSKLSLDPRKMDGFRPVHRLFTRSQLDCILCVGGLEMAWKEWMGRVK